MKVPQDFMEDNTKVNTPKGEAAGLRPVACLKCRARRSYCSKELPKCSRCRDNRLECVYPEGRKITISESYLRNLEARLKAFEDAAAPQQSSSSSNWAPEPIPEETGTDEASSEADFGVEELTQGIHGLLRGANGKIIPKYIEATSGVPIIRKLSNTVGLPVDGSSDIGFESFPHNRAALRVNKGPPTTTIKLPPVHIAKRWYSTHYSYIGTIFEFSTREWFDQELIKAYAGPPSMLDTEASLAYAKVLTILAFGQLYSVNEFISSDGPPGFELFSHAVQYLPSFHEESSILFVETLALVGYYMQNLGERDAAFLYVGTALRMAISLALHQEVQSMQLDDAQRERRRRVWWSVYSMDRILTIKSGNPIMVQDEDIGVGPPSRLVHEPQYGSWIVLRMYTELSKILTRIMLEIYRTEQKSGSSLMASVQNILASLSAWDDELPQDLRFDPNKLSLTRESVSTFLHYNQCVNMTVRPLLFLVVERRMQWPAEQRTKDWTFDLSPPTISAINTCMQSARNTISMITIAAQKGLFATYGYMDGEHCFSAALVLVLVCLAFPCNDQDYAIMDSALQMLQLLVEKGNSNMGPRFQLLQQVRSCIVTPLGTGLPELFMPTSNDIPQAPQLVEGFGQVSDVALGDFWVDSNPADLDLWEAGYATQDPFMEYDILNLTQPMDTSWMNEPIQ